MLGFQAPLGRGGASAKTSSRPPPNKQTNKQTKQQQHDTVRYDTIRYKTKQNKTKQKSQNKTTTTITNTGFVTSQIKMKSELLQLLLFLLHSFDFYTRCRLIHFAVQSCTYSNFYPVLFLIKKKIICGQVETCDR